MAWRTCGGCATRNSAAYSQISRRAAKRVDCFPEVGLLLVNAAHIIWSQAVRALEYAVLHASIPPGAAEALKGVGRSTCHGIEFGLKTGVAAVRTSALRTNPVRTGLWF